LRDTELGREYGEWEATGLNGRTLERREAREEIRIFALEAVKKPR
jgi:hypothetical protein